MLDAVSFLRESTNEEISDTKFVFHEENAQAHVSNIIVRQQLFKTPFLPWSMNWSTTCPASFSRRRLSMSGAWSIPTEKRPTSNIDCFGITFRSIQFPRVPGGKPEQETTPLPAAVNNMSAISLSH
jgi:hypothetical protein